MAQQKRVLGTFTLAMITVAAIISLRNLPLSAKFGFSSIFFLVLAAIIFFIPIALVTAELAAAWPKAGGCYVWVSEAFGKPCGFFALWMAWMESITWFPTILAFSAAMLAYIIAPLIPGLEDNNLFVLVIMLAIFWSATILNFLGIQISGWVSSLGVVLGTLIPGGLIVILGLWWIFTGNPTEISLTWDALIPDFQLDNVVIFSGVLLALSGVELAVFHIREAKNPPRDYPRAVAVASLIILTIYILGTLSVAVLVPQQDISLASGLIQAMGIFFAKVGWFWIVPLLALFLLIGSLAGINAWTAGPAKGMLIVAEDGFLPRSLRYVNKKNVPVSLLVLQAVVGSLLSMVFLYLDDSSAAIWVLTALSAQFTFIQYLLVFAAVLRLRYSQPHVLRFYQVPAIWPVSIIGMLCCIFSFLIVYIPPAQLETGDKFIYRLLLILVLVILSLPPIILAKQRHYSS